MAHGRGQLIIPVRLQKHRPDQKLPICVEPIQLFDMLEGDVDYDNALNRLKGILGEPLHIQQHLEEMLVHYKVSNGKMSLGEVAIRLYDKHRKKITWPAGQKALGEEMIAKSRRALHEYWEKYAEPEKENGSYRTENDSLKRKIESNRSNEKLSFAFIVFLEFLLIVYMYVYLF